MSLRYNIQEYFNSRLDAIKFYHSIYLFTIKFKIITLDIYLDKEDDKYKVFGGVSIIGDYKGVTEANIINHIKKVLNEDSLSI
jgi:hypothetical protein